MIPKSTSITQLKNTHSLESANLTKPHSLASTGVRMAVLLDRSVTLTSYSSSISQIANKTQVVHRIQPQQNGLQAIASSDGALMEFSHQEPTVLISTEWICAQITKPSLLVTTMDLSPCSETHVEKDTDPRV
jgi:hypothetical protein